MDYCIIGENIRKYRKQNGFSQEELSEKVGISVTHMSHIETGYTKLSLSVAVSLANALGVQIDTLLREPTVDTESAERRIGEILGGCTGREADIIADIVKAVKDVLARYN